MNIIFLRMKLFMILSYVKLKGKVINLWQRLWFNRNKLQDSESYMDDVSEISVIEQKEYDSIFLSQQFSTPQIYMPGVVLLKIIHALPENYVFPSPDTSQLLKDELEKYNKEQIDQQILERLQKQLPQNYSLHNPFVFNIHPINSLVGNPKNMINDEVQGQISNNLPPNYKFN